MKRLDLHDAELENLHWLILSVFGPTEGHRKTAYSFVDGIITGATHEKIQYAMVRKDRTPESLTSKRERAKRLGLTIPGLNDDPELV